MYSAYGFWRGVVTTPAWQNIGWHIESITMGHLKDAPLVGQCNSRQQSVKVPSGFRQNNFYLDCPVNFVCYLRKRD